MNTKNIAKAVLILFIITLILSCQNEKARQLNQPLQSKTSLIEDDSIYTVVDEMPRFPGCEDKEAQERKVCADQKMLKYIFKNLIYDPIAKEKGIVGTIVATYIVEKNGDVSNIEIIRGDGQANVIDVLKNMPRFIPGKDKGVVKRVRFNLPIRIHLE